MVVGVVLLIKSDCSGTVLCHKSTYIWQDTDACLMENTPDSSPTALPTRTAFMRVIGTSIGLIAFTNYVSACSKDTGDPAPATTVDFTINWDKSPYSNLQTKGGYVVEQGVVIAQTMAGNFVAVSSACTYNTSALAFQGNNNRFYCPSCQSAFTTGGTVQNGPATKPLKTYAVTINQATGAIRVQG